MMHRRGRSLATGLLLLSLLLTACAQQSQPVTAPNPEPPSLDLIRKQVAVALDSDVSSDDRRAARDSAMRTLLAFLQTPASLRVTQPDWERPVAEGAGPAIHYFRSGKARIYALALPIPGVVPPGERVAVQFSSAGGQTQVSELTTLPGGSLSAVHLVEEGAQVNLIAAYALARGGGYVGVYALDSKTGEFKVNSSSIKGLPTRVGDVTFEPRDQFLQLSWPLPDPWRPRIETSAPVRLTVDNDIALEWKAGKLNLQDERSFSAIQGLHTALAGATSPEDRTRAWEKAVERLPNYLREMASWTEDLSSKLPPGATLSRDQLGTVAVRVISVPAPEGTTLKPITVVQHRISGGLPQAQTVELSGVVQNVRVISRQGLAGLVLLTDATPKGSPKGSLRFQVKLMRQTAGSDWEPAPDWFGYIPKGLGWRFEKMNTAASLYIVPEGDNPQASIAMAPTGTPTIRLCSKPDTCAALTWAGESLTASDWIAGQINALTAQPGQVTPQHVQEAAQAIVKLLSEPEVAALGDRQVATLLGDTAGSPISVLEAGLETRVVALPFNPTGEVPIVISAGGQAFAESPAPRIVETWIAASAFEAGGNKWLLVVGKGRGAWVVVPYRWSENQWRPTALLDQPIDKVIAGRARVSYSPGQSYPVRGFWIYGTEDILVSFGTGGKSLRFCQGPTCLVLQYDKVWTLR